MNLDSSGLCNFSHLLWICMIKTWASTMTSTWLLSLTLTTWRLGLMCLTPFRTNIRLSPVETTRAYVSVSIRMSKVISVLMISWLAYQSLKISECYEPHSQVSDIQTAQQTITLWQTWIGRGLVGLSTLSSYALQTLQAAASNCWVTFIVDAELPIGRALTCLYEVGEAVARLSSGVAADVC